MTRVNKVNGFDEVDEVNKVNGVNKVDEVNRVDGVDGVGTFRDGTTAVSC
jgi:hypothetical protein